jgi:hypothetical protein
MQRSNVQPQRDKINSLAFKLINKSTNHENVSRKNTLGG